MGSPPASAVSGPGCADTYAICLLSGDQATVWPVVGRGLFVPSIAVRNRFPAPSGRARIRPDLSPSLPEYAIHFPSGDHSGLLDGSSPALRQSDLPSAGVMIQS